MNGVVTARDVEAVAREGGKELVVADAAIVTPLAKDRAVALGVVLVRQATCPAPRVHHPDRCASAGAAVRGDEGVRRLALESRVRIVARRTLLRRDGGLARLEDVVAAVLARVADDAGAAGACGCGSGR